MNYVSAQKGHWRSQLSIIAPIFKIKLLKKTVLSFSQFWLVWPSPVMAEARWGHDSWGLGIRGLHDCFLWMSTGVGQYMAAQAAHALWTKSNTAQITCWGEGRPGSCGKWLGAQGEPRGLGQQGWPLGWRTCVGMWGGGGGIGHQSSGGTGLVNNEMAF